ncbi:MAG: M28 family peptidase [Cryomorphaceae bacterium]|jgi:Zn-dependent M28 family amino/carboxypeptidase|nr:M28 family peptidase [Cryomorphaceae bacterium]
MIAFLQEIVHELSVPGFRNAQGEHWPATMAYIEKKILETGHTPEVQEWKGENSIIYRNYIVRIEGRQPKKYILGAHYDTFEDTPGADDNASSVAVLMGVLNVLSNKEPLEYTWEFVFFACEEPPFFGTKAMGSWQHSSSLEPTSVACMICLEMVGYYSDEPGSQDYPFAPMKWFFGNKGNFIMAVSNAKSRIPAKVIIKKLLNQRPSFYKKLILPFELSGLDWSDHRSYWQRNIPALMLTDTAMFRNKNYHTKDDLPETLNYERMSDLTKDLAHLVKTL